VKFEKEKLFEICLIKINFINIKKFKIKIN